jgi:ribosomal-protein-alanine N-acetyltransferase
MTAAEMAVLHAKAFSATRAWSEAEFVSLLTHAGTFYVGNPDSFALIRVVADEAELLTLATDPDKRRQGHARAVLAMALGQATSKGAATMFLEVAEDNRAAIAVYATTGFTQIGRRAGYYTPKNTAPIAALVMQMALKAT